MSSVSLAVRKVNRRGFIKIAVDAEAKQILGAAILGTGGEVIHMALDIIYAKAPYNHSPTRNACAYLSDSRFKAQSPKNCTKRPFTFALKAKARQLEQVLSGSAPRGLVAG